MKYCKSKCAEMQEVNSALLYESCLSDNTLLLISHRISLSEVSAIDVWLSKALSEVKVRHELRKCNPKCEEGKGNSSRASVSEQHRVRITPH